MLKFRVKGENFVSTKLWNTQYSDLAMPWSWSRDSRWYYWVGPPLLSRSIHLCGSCLLSYAPESCWLYGLNFVLGEFRMVFQPQWWQCGSTAVTVGGHSQIVTNAHTDLAHRRSSDRCLPRVQLALLHYAPFIGTHSKRLHWPVNEPRLHNQHGANSRLSL